MSLSINGNNRTFVRAKQTKPESPKETVQPEKQTTKSDAPRVTTAKVATTNVDPSILVANRGLNISGPAVAGPASTGPQVNEVFIYIDAEKIRRLMKILRTLNLN